MSGAFDVMDEFYPHYPQCDDRVSEIDRKAVLKKGLDPILITRFIPGNRCFPLDCEIIAESVCIIRIFEKFKNTFLVWLIE